MIIHCIKFAAPGFLKIRISTCFSPVYRPLCRLCDVCQVYGKVVSTTKIPIEIEDNRLWRATKWQANPLQSFKQ